MHILADCSCQEHGTQQVIELITEGGKSISLEVCNSGDDRTNDQSGKASNVNLQFIDIILETQLIAWSTEIDKLLWREWMLGLTLPWIRIAPSGYSPLWAAPRRIDMMAILFAIEEINLEENFSSSRSLWILVLRSTSLTWEYIRVQYRSRAQSLQHIHNTHWLKGCVARSSSYTWNNSTHYVFLF